MIGRWLIIVGLVYSYHFSYSKPYLPAKLDKPELECREVWGGTDNVPLFEILTDDKGEVLAESNEAKLKRYQAYLTQQPPNPSKQSTKVDSWRANCWKEWLVIVYMAADNDLSPFSYRDIGEMEGKGSTAHVDTVVFQDDMDQQEGMRYYHIAKYPMDGRKRWKKYRKAIEKFASEEGYETSFRNTQEKEFLWEKGPKITVSPVIQTLEEGNSGDPLVAGAFIRWALANYPARRIMLIGWSHGQGFDAVESKGDNQEPEEQVGLKTDANIAGGRQGGFAFDYSAEASIEDPNDAHMKTPEIAAGLRKVIKELRGGTKFDVIGSDSCLNQQVEFGLEFVDVGDFIFGSATVLQARGTNYGTLLGQLTHAPKKATDPDPRESKTPGIVRQLVKLYGKTTSSSTTLTRGYYDPKATMAVWKANELTIVRRALDDLAKELLNWFLSPKDVEMREKRRTEFKTAVVDQTLRYHGISHDLFEFIVRTDMWVNENLKELQERGVLKGQDAAIQLKIQREAGAVRSALLKAVPPGYYYIGKAYKSELGVDNSRGVAIWLPGSYFEYEEMFPKFNNFSLLYRLEKDDGKQLTEKDPRSNWSQFVSVLFAHIDDL